MSRAAPGRRRPAALDPDAATTPPERRAAEVTELLPNGTESVARCRIGGCDSPRKARGLCATHYQRQRRTGDPNTVRAPGRPRSKGNAMVRHTWKGTASERSMARYIHALRLFAELEVAGLGDPDADSTREALALATLPDGRFNFSRFERIAIAHVLFSLAALNDEQEQDHR